MDQPRVPKLEGPKITIKKRRTQPSRRPKPEGQLVSDRSPRSSTPLSDDTSKVSSDDVGDYNSGGKMFNLNSCVARSLPVNGAENAPNSFHGNGVSADATGSETKPKKVKLKLKVGGASSTKTVQQQDNSRPKKRSLSQVGYMLLLLTH